MSNLLEFQHNVVGGNKTIFSIETSELNPEDLEAEEVEESREEFKKERYSIKILREYIQKHSSKLAEVGNVIQGDIKNNNVILTILKIN